MSEGFTIVQETYGEVVDDIKFQGTVAQIEHVFGVTMVMPSRDKIANLNDPLIPQRFAPVVLSISGLDNLGGVGPASLRPPHAASNRPTYGGARRRFALSESPVRFASLSAAPRATLYDLIGGQLGFGPNDLSTFYGLAPLKSANINATGTDCIGFISLTDFLDAAVDKCTGRSSAPSCSRTGSKLVELGGLRAKLGLGRSHICCERSSATSTRIRTLLA